MKLVNEILKEAEANKITLYVKNGKLAYLSESGGFPEELKSKIAKHKEIIISTLVESAYENEASTNASSAIELADREQLIPLSYGQQRLWLVDQLNNDSREYNLSFTLQLNGLLDLNALQNSLDCLVKKHEILRTTYHIDETGSEVEQKINERSTCPLKVIDLSNLDAQRQQDKLDNVTAEESGKAFNLDSDLMLRVVLIQLADNKYELLFVQHHISSDGWSLALLVHEFTSAYKAFVAGEKSPLQPLNIQYADFAAWQRNSLSHATLEKDLSFWEQQLKGAPALHSLPIDKERPLVQSNSGAVEILPLSREITTALKALSERESVTLFILLETIFAVLVSRYSLDNDVVIGTPVAGRDHADLDPLIGFFVNNLLLRCNVDSSLPFTSLLANNKATILEAYDHQQVPFEMLIDHLNVERSLSHSALFQIMFGLNNNEIEDIELPGLHTEVKVNDTDTAKVDLEVAIVEKGDELQVKWIYNTDLFEPSTIQSLLGSYLQLIKAVLQEPSQEVGRLPLLAPQQLEALITEGQGQSVEFNHVCIHELFNAQVIEKPNAIALEFEGQVLTYAELDDKANRLAHYLIESGVTPDTLVGLYMQRSFELVVAIWAVLKAGGAYVPLEFTYPKERLNYIIEDTGLSTIISQTVFENIDLAADKNWIYLDSAQCDQLLDSQSSTQPIVPDLAPSNLAYVIYTSGSTGMPKGVQIEHRALVNRVDWMQNEYQLTSTDKVLQKTPFSFDVSVWEFVWPMVTGAQLVIARPEGHKEPEYLCDLINTSGITTLHFVPSMLSAILQFEQFATCSSLTKVFCSGEALPVTVQDRFLNTLSAELHNLYGPTEAAIDVSNWQCEIISGQSSVPIGLPIQNIDLHILDKYNVPLPNGVVGELHIGGVGLARGYLNREALTEEKFIHSTHSGTRLYKTGDLVKRSKSGAIEYIGRMDDQVKLRGFRIELGEIEHTLHAMDEVKDAAVVVWSGTGNEQDKSLVAYIVPQGDINSEGEEQLYQACLTHLNSQLPAHMVPMTYMAVEYLPVTSNGKLDRKALPTPSIGEQNSSEYEAPRNSIEQNLVDVWQEVLKIERVGIHDNFFALGGDSILSLQTVSKSALYGISFTAQQVISNQTIAELAAVVNVADTVSYSQKSVMGEQVLLPIQQEFFAANHGDFNHYNQAVLLKTEQHFNHQVLADVFSAIYQRHDALRLRFNCEQETWNANYVPFSDDIVSASCLIEMLESGEDEAIQIERRCNFHQASLNITDGPVFKMVYFKGSESGRLFLVAHHLVIDGLSWRILLSDLESAYEQAIDDRSIVLANKQLSFQSWANALQEQGTSEEILEQAAFWQSQLNESSAPIAKAQSETTASTYRDLSLVEVSLDEKQTTALLTRSNQAYLTQINELLLCSLFLGFEKWSSSQELNVMMEGHGREHEQLAQGVSETVGWFTSKYPLKLSSDSVELNKLIPNIKEQCRQIPHNGIGYGLLSKFNPESGLSELESSDGPQIMFNYLGQFDQALAADSVFQIASESTGRAIGEACALLYALEINGLVLDGQLRFSFGYDRSVLSQEAVSRLSICIKESLQDVINHCVSIEKSVFTPIDFPLATVSFEQLNELQARFNISKLYPATSMQQGMYFHDLIDKSSYVTQVFPTICGDLDIALFKQAWELAVQQFDILRTAFIDIEGVLHQLVAETAHLKWLEEDWSTKSTDQQTADFVQLRQNEKSQGLDVETPSVMKVSVLKLGANKYQVLWSHHHMLLDGWSMPQVYHFVLQSYGALLGNSQQPSKPNAEFEDYIRWYQNQDAGAAKQYWQSYLEGVDEATFVSDKSQTPRAKRIHASKKISLDSTSSEALRTFAKKQKTTLNTLIQVAWGIVLQRLTGNENPIFGAIISGRPAQIPSVETMVGLFINNIPVRVSGLEGTLSEVIEQLHQQFNTSQSFGYLPLLDIQKQAMLGTELFDTLLVFENYPLGAGEQAGTGLQVEKVEVDIRDTYPLVLEINDNESLDFSCNYFAEELSSGHITSILTAFLRTLSQLPNVEYAAHISLLDEQASADFAALNDTARAY
ncbi:hypothetical protein N474_22255, partial [Pseudoalteromonas luteoviolacea CPMOR-2]|uniref:non-ribosomal peptide synthetase n=1 Tax=Pseudoalteromonas luteoviolacea TaxID=43657 RepID=UPI0007B1736B